MTFSKTRLDGVFLIQPEVHSDNRGYFMETYVKKEFEKQGIAVDFIQDNHSYTGLKNTIRGMHFQINPHAQVKLVRVVRGEILNVVVDLREGSPTFKQWISVGLSADSKQQLFVPAGFANGYCTLADDTEICYKVDNYYAPEFDRAFQWNDPSVGIEWPTNDPILSDRDRTAPTLSDAENNFVYGRPQ